MAFASQSSAGKMYICSALAGAASVATVCCSLFFRIRSSHGGACTDRYQLYVQVSCSSAINQETHVHRLRDRLRQKTPPSCSVSSGDD
eukprot:3437628-Rhodomonas_salina.2